jgi:uncharacterized protein
MDESTIDASSGAVEYAPDQVEAGDADRAAPERTNIVARHPIVSYFVFAYAFTWGFIGIFLIGLKVPLNGLTNVFVIAGPTVAALVATALCLGGPGVVQLLKRLVLVRVNVFWYAFALIIVPLLFVVGTIVLPGAIAAFAPVPADVIGQAPLTFVLVWFVGGPLLEEIGWRGFALPRLQRRLNPTVASLILGLLWAVWHFPLYLLPAFAEQNGGLSFTSLALYTVSVLAMTFVFTWVFNRTRGSLFIAVLLHTAINTFSVYLAAMFPKFGDDPLAALGGVGVFAIVLIVVTRTRLGYDPRRDYLNGGSAVGTARFGWRDGLGSR